MMTGTPEIEWQFDTTDLDSVRAWLTANADGFGLEIAPSQSVPQTDTYFDTPDWQLYRAGCALRVRRRGGSAEATLKSFGTIEAGARRRHEISEPVRAPVRLPAATLAQRLLALPGPVGERIRLAAPGATLHRLFEARMDRVITLLRRDDADLAEVAFDTVRVIADPGRAPLLLRRLEVEAKTSDVAGLEPLVVALREACGLTPAGLSKFELGLKMGGLHPALAPYFGAPSGETELLDQVGAEPSIGVLAFAVMRERFAQFAATEPGTRMGDDPEFVHDMRVATRRLRAAMSLFAPFIPHHAQALREELRWVAAALGAVRDLDTQLEHLEHAWPAASEGASEGGYDAVREMLGAQRKDARSALITALDSRRYAHLVSSFEELMREGPQRLEVAQHRASRVLPALIEQRYRKVRKAGADLGPASPPAAYHALRIRVKRFRYALEFSHAVFGAAVDPYLPGVLALQDILGGYQDAQVAIAHMRALSLSDETLIPPQTVFALGEMAQHRAAQAQALLAQFPEAWKRVTGRSWRQLRKAIA